MSRLLTDATEGIGAGDLRESSQIYQRRGWHFDTQKLAKAADDVLLSMMEANLSRYLLSFDNIYLCGSTHLISLAVAVTVLHLIAQLFFRSIIIASSIMKSSTIALTVATALASFGLLPSTLAFQMNLSNNSYRQSTKLYEYIPSGFTKQSWAAFKKKEADAKKAKNLGK